MALAVTRITPALVSRIDTHYPTMVARFSATFKCSLEGADYPDIEWLKSIVVDAQDVYAVAVAVDSGTFAGLAVVNIANKRVNWLIPNSQYAGGVPAIYEALSNWARATFGEAWGIVENPAVRTLMRGDSRFRDGTGDRLDWTG